MDSAVTSSNEVASLHNKNANKCSECVEGHCFSLNQIYCSVVGKFVKPTESATCRCFEKKRA